MRALGQCRRRAGVVRSSLCRSLATGAAPAPRQLSLDELTALCKRRGFIFAGSELYGSIGAGFDYGPLGAALKRNLADAWWKDFVERRPDCVALDTALIMNPRVWHASGHVEQFVDPLTECSTCRRRVRADKLVDQALGSARAAGTALPAHLDSVRDAGKLSLAELGAALTELRVACPGCGAVGEGKGLGKPRTFNLLFSTHVGPVLPEDGAASAGAAAAAPAGGDAEGNGGASPLKQQRSGKGGKGGGASSPPQHGSASFLRPETAQGAYVQFANVLNSTRRKLPLGVGQVGRSFRNEISPGQFIFRTREFEQAELEFFCAPADSARWYRYWVDFCHGWLQRRAGLRSDSLRLKEYAKEELAHYAAATTDIEFRFPFGWDELWGIADRGDFDLRAHSAASGLQLQYTDPVTKQSFFPHVVEPALGINRLMLAVLADGFVEEPAPAAAAAGGEGGEEGSGKGGGAGEPRLVFRVHEDLAPIKVAVLPLMKKDPLVQAAEGLLGALLQHTTVEMDATQSIGRRYRRYDEAGTPLCVTVDPATPTDQCVTVRDRDSMAQLRMPIAEVLDRAAKGTLKPSAIPFPRQ